MQKGFFIEQQKPVSSVEDKKRGTVSVFICLNEKQETVPSQTIQTDGEPLVTEPYVQWVYDFNSFTVPTTDIDLNDIQKNPSNYLNYDPDNKDEIAALKKENKELKENMNLLSDCITELSEQVYS